MDQAQKLLSISVAAYNGAATLHKALSSCLIPQMDRLEVIVVDDGSRDDTRQIADGYAERYPGVFRVLHQENGGYGSTIDAALQLASGRYFRTLDCDDWFDTEALQQLVAFLGTCEADVVFTDYATVREDRRVRTYAVGAGRVPRQTQRLDEQLGLQDYEMEIHAVTFRRQDAWKTGMQLPRHCQYTDLLYVVRGLQTARTVCFLPVVLYNYRLGRDGQSVSLASYQTHFDAYELVTGKVLAAAVQSAGTDAGPVLCRRARDIAQYGIELLLRFPRSRANKERLRAYDRMLRTEYPQIAGQMRDKDIRLLRATRYGLYAPLTAWKAHKEKGIDGKAQ